MDNETKQAVLGRLRRIAGQVGGIERMVAEERYCVDVLLQMAAARSALTQAAKLMLTAHVETCTVEAFASGDEAERRQKIDELLEVFSRYGQG